MYLTPQQVPQLVHEDLISSLVNFHYYEYEFNRPRYFKQKIVMLINRSVNSLKKEYSLSEIWEKVNTYFRDND